MIKTISAQNAKELLDKDSAVLIDVREKDEFDSEYIKGATLIPLSTFTDNMQKIPLGDKAIIMQCKSGGRSGKACEILYACFGEKEVYNLEGGILKWKELGYATTSKN